MALAWHRCDDESAEQFEYFTTWRQLPRERKANRLALLQALGLPDTRVNRNRINRWRQRFRWAQHAADFVAGDPTGSC